MLFLYAFGISASRQNGPRYDVHYDLCLRHVNHPEAARRVALEEAACEWPEEGGWGNHRATVRLIDFTSIALSDSTRVFASVGFSMWMEKTPERMFFNYVHPVSIVRGQEPGAIRHMVLTDMRRCYPDTKGWDQHQAGLIEITPADFVGGSHLPLC